MKMNFARFARTSNVNTASALTASQLRSMVPSAYATSKHESRSARYTYIRTSEVIDGLIANGFQPVQAFQGGSRIEGKAEFTKHLIRFRQIGAQLSKVGDTLPEVVLINSHDGTSSYKLFAGLFRLVCSNGLIIADKMLGELTVPHKGDIVDNVIDGSFQIIGQAKKTLERVEDWSVLALTAGEQDAFAEAAHTLRFADAEGKTDTPITAAQLLRPRRLDDMRDGASYGENRPAADLYRTLNVVQENVIRGGLSGYARNAETRRTRRVTTREINGIDQNVRLNRALWQLAERMAELKGVSSAA
jgi:hypothetical protein